MSEDSWDPGDEDGLVPSRMVALARRLQMSGIITLEWDGVGFVADVDGVRWDPYGLLTELLEDLGDER